MEALTINKMECIKQAEDMENEAERLKTKCTTVTKGIEDVVKLQSKLDMEYDDAITACLKATEKQEAIDEEYGVFELQLQELTRRDALLIAETTRVNERLVEVLDKLAVTETNLENNERVMKVKEAQALSFDEKGTLVESQLEEAVLIAEESHRKQDDAERKLRMVQNELERVTDKADEYESKIKDFDDDLLSSNKKLRDLEEFSVDCSTKEDAYEEELHRLRKDLEDQDTRAEFGERTVEKLENTVDRLSDEYLSEKMKFKDLSVQLDTALNDIMEATKMFDIAEPVSEKVKAFEEPKQEAKPEPKQVETKPEVVEEIKEEFKEVNQEVNGKPQAVGETPISDGIELGGLQVGAAE